jgi:hypothetical protein
MGCKVDLHRRGHDEYWHGDRDRHERRCQQLRPGATPACYQPRGKWQEDGSNSGIACADRQWACLPVHAHTGMRSARFEGMEAIRWKRKPKLRQRTTDISFRDLPTGNSIAREFERFLRQQTGDPG